MDNIFTELSIVIAVAVGVSLFMRFIRQPLIIGYILTGLLVGPSFLNIVHNPETIEVFSDFGIALLLLIVGLGLNPRIVREVGRIAGAIAVVKIGITTGVGYLVSQLLGYSTSASLYIGIALSFSSTIIILKLLGDKKELSRLYGKISIGFLLVEDVVATFALVIVSAAGSGDNIAVGDFGILLLKIFGLITGVVLFRMLVINNIRKIIAGSQDFLFLFAIGWALGIAALFQWSGFSLEIGALVAGVALASLPYASEISSRLKVLRDFFIVLFFISLGSHLKLGNITDVLPQALILSVIVLLANPIIVMTVMGLGGYTKKTSFKTGMAGAQVSEFSLILLLLAFDVGQIEQRVVSLVTIVALITIGISTYMILYSEQLYNLLEKYLQLFERRHARERKDRQRNYELVLIGYHKGGHEFLKVFKSLKKKYLIIDYDPTVIETLEHRGEDFMYGDVTDLEFLEEINLEKSRLIVSTVSDIESNMHLARWMEKHNPNAVFISTADTVQEAASLYELGVAYVMLPHYIGSEKIGSFIRKNGFNKTEFKHYREKHMAYLQTHPDMFVSPNQP